MSFKFLLDFGPGPAAYPSECKGNELIKSLYPQSEAFSYSLGNRRCLGNTSINPGPAAYPIIENSKSKYFNEKLKINSLQPQNAANRFTFGYSRNPLKSTIQTEPALYPSIGRSLVPDEQRHKFTFSGRPKTYKSKFQTPGPAMYPIMKKEKINSIYPSETKLRTTMRAPFKDVFKSNSPPPNIYPRDDHTKMDIMKAMIPGPSAPAYSIRRRYDK